MNNIKKNNKCDVILSAGGALQESYQAALAANEIGYSFELITSFYYKKNSFPYNLLSSIEIKFKNSANNLFKQLKHRNEPSLPEDQVVPILLPEMLGRGLKRSPIVRDLVNWGWVTCTLFDILSMRHIARSKIFHGWPRYVRFSAKRAKKLGAKIILNCPAAHPDHRRKILVSEYSRLGLKAYLPDVAWLTITPKVFPIADLIFAPSQFVKDTLLEAGVDENKIDVIPYGVDAKKFSYEKPKTNQQFTLLCVASLSVNKGTLYLLKAWQKLRLKNAKLILVGQVEAAIQPYLDKYKDMYQHYEYIPHDDLPNLYSRSTIFVLPSLTEGSALVIYEAMASGKPCIVTHNCGSVIRNGIDGYVIPIRDHESLAEKILCFYNNSSLVEEMGTSARANVLMHTWDAYREKIAKAYNKIISE